MDGPSHVIVLERDNAWQYSRAASAPGPFTCRETAISAAIRGASLKTHNEDNIQSGAPRRRGIDACLHRDFSWRPYPVCGRLFDVGCFAPRIGRAYRPSDLFHRGRCGSYINAGSVVHLARNALSTDVVAGWCLGVASGAGPSTRLSTLKNAVSSPGGLVRAR
jgi:hypothetical protein